MIFLSRFGILAQINDIGVDIQIVGRSAETFNRRGDLSGVTLTYTNVTGIVQEFSSEDIEVQEGIMKPKDAEAWFDEDISVSGSLIIGNSISGSFFGSTSREYVIKEVMQELGHFRVLAAKL